MRLRWVVLTSVVLAGVLVATVLRDRQPMLSEYCIAEVGDTRAQIDNEQARWTSLMAAIAQRRGLPPRATTIAIATAFQESKIHNVDYGDRDSLGLFQQRPSQGWGTPAQILDPYYSIERFYDGLVKVRGYEGMTITTAAQRVQRSAFPSAYAQHEDYARALASSLRGYSPTAFTCRVNPVGGGTSDKVADEITAAFGDIRVEVADKTVRLPLKGRAPDVEARGWGLAHFAVGNASRLKVARVAFDGHVWTAEASTEGWIVEPRSSRRTVVEINLG